MAIKKRIKIKPIEDVELHYKRNELVSYITIPDTIDENTGVFFVVNDFKEDANSEAMKEELRPFICEKTNCIVVGVNYFGYLRGKSIEFNQSFISNINRIYGLNLSPENFKPLKSDTEAFVMIASAIVNKRISTMDIRCQPIIKTGNGEYQSWGFLPALDNLLVLGKILQEYNINKKRIFVYGKNYGGYIAYLMAKFAPNTFTAVIEREGYSKAELRHIVGGEIMEPDTEIRLNIQGYDHDFTIACAADNPWTIENEDSPNYFSDAHRKIRSLLAENHRIPNSKTKYFCYHTQDNGFSSFKHKEKLVELLKATNEVEFQKASSEEPFTNLSDREFLDRFFETHDINTFKASAETDFDKNSKLSFDCGVREYVFEYSQNGDLKVTL